jgi:flagellar motor protein MotB
LADAVSSGGLAKKPLISYCCAYHRGVPVAGRVKDERIQVEGHTDNVPIVAQKNRYPDRWELSAVRASEVVQYHQDEDGIDPGLLSTAGFSDTNLLRQTIQMRAEARIGASKSFFCRS